MTEDVLISIKGLHAMSDGGDQEKVEIIYAGRYFLRNGKHYVVYEEKTEDGQLIRNRVKFWENRLEMQKAGVVDTGMHFRLGHREKVRYQTQYGEMLLGIHTTDIRMRESGDRIDMWVEYELEMNEEHISDASIHLQVMEQKKGLLHLNQDEQKMEKEDWRSLADWNAEQTGDDEEQDFEGKSGSECSKIDLMTGTGRVQ